MEHINVINDPKLQILNNDTMWSKNNNIGKKHGLGEDILVWL
jgi:hypothetical protein